MYSCRNNYFAAMRIGGERELAKEILRAEAFVKTRAQEPFDLVMAARKVSTQSGPDRKHHIKDVVLSLMKQSGQFVRTSDDTCWYIRRDNGRPVQLEKHSMAFDAMLNINYGLNGTETDFAFVEQALIDYGQTLPVSGVRGALSFYDIVGNQVYLHTGRREVIHIKPNAVERIVNGSSNMVFGWNPNIDPFTVDLTSSPTREHWSNLLFGDSFNHVVNLTPEEAMAVMQVWFLFVMLRTASQSRPILSLFGSPGSGKSAIFKKIYAVLFGRVRGLQAITNADDFDHSVATEPLVVLDNVDTWERWLPDRLALSAGVSDIIKRRLYQNTDVVVLKRQAMLALTAHNPQFSRPDVADRLLIINMERLPNFRPEGPMYDRVIQMRHSIMGGVAQDIQRILNTNQPDETTLPQFRIEDFVRIGCWIGDATGIRPAFESAIRRIKASQRHFSVEDEALFVESMIALLRAKKGDTDWLSSTGLWNELTLRCRDPKAFSTIYKNAPQLSRRLIGMQEPLRDTFKVTWKMTPNGRSWRFQQLMAETSAKD
jgi:hypothetical protein